MGYFNLRKLGFQHTVKLERIKATYLGTIILFFPAHTMDNGYRLRRLTVFEEDLTAGGSVGEVHIFKF